MWVSPSSLVSEDADAGPVTVTAGAPGSPGPGLDAGRAAWAIRETKHFVAGWLPPHREQKCGRASRCAGAVCLHLPLLKSRQGSRWLSPADLPVSLPLPLPLPLPWGLSPLGLCQHCLAEWPGTPQMVHKWAGGLPDDVPPAPAPLPLPPPLPRAAFLPLPV